MLRDLTNTKRAVLETMRMRLSERQALGYLEAAGYPMKHAQYYRHKRELKAQKLERLHYIAAMGFEDQHLDRIDICELIARLHWQNYMAEKNPFKRSMILKEIKELQPYISSYYEATKAVLGYSGQGQQEPSDISNSEQKQEPESKSWTI